MKHAGCLHTTDTRMERCKRLLWRTSERERLQVAGGRRHQQLLLAAGTPLFPLGSNKGQTSGAPELTELHAVPQTPQRRHRTPRRAHVSVPPLGVSWRSARLWLSSELRPANAAHLLQALPQAPLGFPDKEAALSGAFVHLSRASSPESQPGVKAAQQRQDARPHQTLKETRGSRGQTLPGDGAAPS